MRAQGQPAIIAQCRVGVRQPGGRGFSPIPLSRPGNHETDNMNQIYGFEGEVKAKYTAQMYELFSEVFEWLPLAQCINGKVLVRAAGGGRPAGEGGEEGSFPHRNTPLPQIMHGGLFSEDGVTLDDIRKIERNRQPPDSGEWAPGTEECLGSRRLGALGKPGAHFPICILDEWDFASRGTAKSMTHTCHSLAPLPGRELRHLLKVPETVSLRTQMTWMLLQGADIEMTPEEG